MNGMRAADGTWRAADRDHGAVERRIPPLSRAIRAALVAGAIAVACGGAGRSNAQASEWDDYLQALKPLGDLAASEIRDPGEPRSRQEAWRTLIGNLAQGYIAYASADPDYPEFVSLFNSAVDFYGPNPDYVYRFARIGDGGTYRIKGFRGTDRFVDITMLKDFYLTVGPNVVVNGLIDLDKLHLGPDGGFDLLISAARPAGYTGDWQALPAGTNTLLLRAAAYDWNRERDPVVLIERTDVPARKPDRPAADLAARLAFLPRWIENGAGIAWRRAATLRQAGTINQIKPVDYSNMAGIKGQMYLEGLFELAEDEALILETDVPKSCRYWGFMLSNDQMNTLDWTNRQSSLNGFQARIDRDGKFRAVVSRRDPKVPNWLDPGDRRDGAMLGRWNNCDVTPLPTARKVKLADLRNYLPADTPTISPAERDAALRLRRDGAQARRKW